MTRNIVVLGVVSPFTDISSQMIFPLLLFFDHVMAIHEDAVVVAGFGALMVILAVWMFNIQE